MPYIDKIRRQVLDLEVGALCQQLRSYGELNYALTVILLCCYNTGVRGYERLNALVGVLECVKQEFYRRVVAPYEEEKRKQKGDVY